MTERARILIVERNEALAAQLAAALKEAGYDVTITAAPLDALKKVYEARPDLIIAGADLPTVKGEDALLRIRQASYVLILALGPREEMVDILESVADGYMTSPPSLVELVAKVHSMLRRKPRYEPPGGNPRLDIENHLPKGG